MQVRVHVEAVQRAEDHNANRQCETTTWVKFTEYERIALDSIASAKKSNLRTDAVDVGKQGSKRSGDVEWTVKPSGSQSLEGCACGTPKQFALCITSLPVHERSLRIAMENFDGVPGVLR